MSTEIAKEPSPRRRASPRQTGEVRRLLLESARQCFSDDGYSGATTRKIAAVAGVNEALLFRHFGSKETLFRESVVEPLQAAFVALVEGWKQVAFGSSPHDPMATMGPYVSSLTEFIDHNRPLLMATLTAGEYESHSYEGAGAMFGAMFEWLEEGTQAEAQAHGWENFDPYLAPRLVFGVVAAMRLFDHWLLPNDRLRPSDRFIKQETAAFMVHGLAHRPPDTNPATFTESPRRGRRRRKSASD